MRGRRVVRLLCWSVIIVEIMSWVSVTVTSRPFVTNDGDHHGVAQPGTDQSPQSLQATSWSSKEGCEKMSGSEAEEEADLSAGGVDDEGRNKMGSRPPSCEHKCLGCMPCEAIQMPTTTARVGVQYANYEPEFWKCKCGPSFYSP